VVQFLPNGLHSATDGACVAGNGAFLDSVPMALDGKELVTMRWKILRTEGCTVAEIAIYGEIQGMSA